VGSVTISVSAGQRVSIRLKLTRAAQRLLALKHKLSLALAFVLTPTTGTSSLVRREFTVTTHRRVKG
jgi:hypothetical protein